MKNLALLILLILIFLGCGWVGFQLANETRFAQQQPAEKPVSDSEASQQYNVLLITVDQLNSDRPRLLSIWFISTFVMDGQPLTLTFGQVYAGTQKTQAGKQLEQSFLLDAQHSPTEAFWKAFQSYGISVRNFVIVDTFALYRIFRWMENSDSTSMEFDPTQLPDLGKGVKDNCQKLHTLNNRLSSFPWSDLVPNHFHSNLELDNFLVRWSQVTDPALPINCEYLPHN